VNYLVITAYPGLVIPPVARGFGRSRDVSTKVLVQIISTHTALFLQEVLVEITKASIFTSNLSSKARLEWVGKYSLISE
jgi:hypothetical protein